MEKYDFEGWATRANMKCSDGRTIMKDAFSQNDGQTVPLVWNHSHSNLNDVLGHALLENREEGVWAKCKFNETPDGQTAKLLVEHGDITALSIYANQLKQSLGNVVHGNIREVSLVLAGANPGASIQSVIAHSDTTDEEAVIYTGEEFELYHADNSENSEPDDGAKKETEAEKNGDGEKNEDETVADILKTLNEKQIKAVAAVVEAALENNDENVDDETGVDEKEGGNKEMKHNVFEKDTADNTNVLSHADQTAIIELAKSRAVGSLQEAINVYADNNKETLAHGIDDIESLFPDYKDVRPGAPEFVERDKDWVGAVMKGVHKSPISRIRTRQADIRDAQLRAKGYPKKGKYKTEGPNFKLLSRTTDPQTVYRKDAMNRDDIIDITDFDVVEYQYQVMKRDMNEELATAFLIGDGREEGDPDKIYQEHIRSIWHDDDLYAIHYDIDIEAAKNELQGTDTAANFGENYIYSEAMVTAALYSREQYKGSGNMALFCTPHLVNVMLLARDLNGRRIYSSKADLAAALNVNEIHTVEQFEGKVRNTSDGKKKKLIGIMVNLSDYQVGATKGGEITRFNQFDIDFNQEKYLIEARLSGALTKVYSAIVLEEDVTDSF